MGWEVVVGSFWARSSKLREERGLSKSSQSNESSAIGLDRCAEAAPTVLFPSSFDEQEPLKMTGMVTFVGTGHGSCEDVSCSLEGLRGEPVEEGPDSSRVAKEPNEAFWSGRRDEAIFCRGGCSSTVMDPSHLQPPLLANESCLCIIGSVMSLKVVWGGWPVSTAGKSTLLDGAGISGLMPVASVSAERMLCTGIQQRASELSRLSDL